MMKFINCLLTGMLSGIAMTQVFAQLPMPDYVCPGETKHYYVDDTPGSFYIWKVDGIIQKGSSNSEFVYTWNKVKTFLLEVQEVNNEGCPGPVRSGIVVVSALGSKGLIIHEAFSPNGDIINDVWNIGNNYLYPEMEVFIYNRWGQLVWRSGKGYPEPWDGKSSGKDLPVDSYHYVIDLHNGTKPLIGVITVLK